MTEYIKFKLSHGQQAPAGSTGNTISGSEHIVWTGEALKDFDANATFGTILEGDTTPSGLYEYENMTEEEITNFLE